MAIVWTDLLARAERNRVDALSSLEPKTQDALGQFFTPVRAAQLIGSMPRLPEGGGRIAVLDPGAGSGMLSAALVARVLEERSELSVHVVAVECDRTVIPQLMDTLEACKVAGEGRVTFEVVEADFVAAATGISPDERLAGFDLVIQNPPYAKLSSSASARVAVRAIGADAPNLYAAFLALGTHVLGPGGQLVAITPRSFCNGPYFGKFRSYFLDRVAIDRLHVFESRSTVFFDTGVLQENVILSGTKNGVRDTVLLSSSDGHEDDASHRWVPYDDVVSPQDPHRFVRMATNDEDVAIAEKMMSLPATLGSLGIAVSTGRVVDFRARECLHSESVSGGVPLIYPGNVRNGFVEWPREMRKPQWFLPIDRQHEKMLFSEGRYCVVKRFSAKEERRRVAAGVWSPEFTPGAVAFENHLNVFHDNGTGLDKEFSHGLSLWLNSSLVDQFFRTFSGHTQVNATDLRNMRYPDIDTLRKIGSDSMSVSLSQEELDLLVEQAIDPSAEAV